MIEKKEIEKICMPLRDLGEEAYQICVNNGYLLARDVLDGAIDDTIYNIERYPSEYTDIFGYPPEELAEAMECVESDIDFTEDDVIQVMEGWIEETVGWYNTEIRNGNTPDLNTILEVMTTDTILNEQLDDVVYEKIKDTLRQCNLQ